MSAQISEAEVRYYQERASDNQQPNLIATIVLCLALPCIAVFLRFLARWRTKAGFKADDWLIFAALVQFDSRDSESLRDSSANIVIVSMRWYVYNYWSRRPLRGGQTHNFCQQPGRLRQGILLRIDDQ